MSPLASFDRSDISCVVLQRRPNLGRGSKNIIELAGQNADDGIAVVVERHLASDNRRVAAKAPPPKSVADDRYFRAMKHIVGSLHVSSERRRHAKRSEVAGADLLSIDTFRLIRSSEGRLPWLHYSDCVKRATPLRQFAISVEGLGDAGAVFRGIPDHHDPAGMRIGQRLEQDRVHRAENRRAGSDAETENHDRRAGEARVPAQLPERVAKIVK